MELNSTRVNTESNLLELDTRKWILEIFLVTLKILTQIKIWHFNILYIHVKGIN